MASRLVTETIPGSPDGMNVAAPANTIKDTEAQYIQDALLDYPALTRRRGPVRNVASIAQPTLPVTGIATALDPNGTPRYGVLQGDATHGTFKTYSDDLLSLVDIGWANNLPVAPYHLSHIKTGLKGGTFIGTSSKYDKGATQAVAYWLGANKATYQTGTLTFTRGSKTVTGAGTSFLANVAVGMWVFADTDEGYSRPLIGSVASVDSNTQVTLATPAPYAATAKAYTMQALRGVIPRVTTGRITCATTATAVNGGATKFLAQGLNAGIWNIYRSRDWAFVGKVSSVQSDSALTLAANAAVAMADDSYIAIHTDGDASYAVGATEPGWITATYAGRQFYINNGDTHDDTYRLVYSDTDDAEAIDLSEDGSWTPVGSSSIVQESARGMEAAYNALLVFKENETFGLYGSTPGQFEIKKIEDDGALSGMSVQPYGGGVIWAGREGIHFYDGVQVTNLMAEKFGKVWKDTLRTFDPNTYRMWSMMARDHYFLFIENLDPTIQPTKGGVSEVVTQWTVVVNMTTLAPALMTNVGVRGAVTTPASSGHTVWYVVNDATQGHVCSADDLFDTEGLDVITCVGATAGPDFFYESKKFDAGDSLLLKKFKVLAMHYLAQGGALKVDVVLGLNEFGQTIASEFPASVFTWDKLRATFTTWNALKAQFGSWSEVINGVLLPKRVKFQKTSQFFSFRVYQENLTMPRVKIGPYQIAYKIMRAGRV
jgi:hypothetical protein